jgi:2-polyprenyl-3-methyl-5-hydroxy-6-metoxy-1,4-benzoquinol methylase
MSRASFEHFGRLATKGVDGPELALRYSFHRDSENRIVADVEAKLRLTQTDTLLEIGCGAGNLLIPLAKRVSHAAGIDHLALLKDLPSHGIEAIGGNFLDVRIDRHFSKIFIYSVLQYLSDRAEIFQFVEKAAGLLDKDGYLLLGDLPNVDKKRRFDASDKGKEVLAAWRRDVAGVQKLELPDDDKTPVIDDALIGDLVAHFSREGFSADRLEQPEGLPVCYTREDVLIVRRI